MRPLRVAGKENLVLLAGVLAAVAFLRRPLARGRDRRPRLRSPTRAPTAELRKANRFTFHPILEVAALFAGIFVTMLPALDLLRARGAELGVREPWQFFWATGALSSFLDNAPTYLTFLALAQGLGQPAEVVGVPHATLVAISLGAVFMGANTYIGNGPNFMVRSIAEERGVKMPSFGGYMLYSGARAAPRLPAGHAGVLPPMSPGWAAFAAVLGANALLTGSLALRVWRQSHVPGRRAFAGNPDGPRDMGRWIRVRDPGAVRRGQDGVAPAREPRHRDPRAALLPVRAALHRRERRGLPVGRGGRLRGAGPDAPPPVLPDGRRASTTPASDPSRTRGGRWSCPAGPGTTCRRCTRTS